MNLEQTLAQHQKFVRANFKLMPPARREAQALREMRARLQPFMPLFQFLADAAKANPKLMAGAMTLPQTNIEIPIADAVEFVEFVRLVERDVLTKT